MKERPILFSAPMVCALRDGQKTQTRRVIKPQPPCECEYVINGAESHALCRSVKDGSIWVPPTAKSVDHRLLCPYGAPGDRLWVKETFVHDDDFHGHACTWYRADHDTFPGMWKPSIFMRRAYSRLTLEITAVRLERLHDISEDDAKAEGVKPWHSDGHRIANNIFNGYRTAYAELWRDINGHGERHLDGSFSTPGCWVANPWVWVIEFKRLPQTQPGVPATP